MRYPLTRRRFNTLALFTGAACVLPARPWLLAAEAATHPAKFLHPGLLHSREDLARMRTAIQSKQDPIYAGFKAFCDDPQSRLDYKPAGASAEIGRNPSVRFLAFDGDANAAYQCALRWQLTGDRRYAELAARLLNDWAVTLQRITGADAILCTTLGGFKMVNAAELLRDAGPVWSPADAEKFAALLREVFLPVIFNFAAFANGNWDTAVIKLMLAIAVYTEDRALFDRALVYYLHGCGDGRLDHYIYPSGQCQESGRDQQHTQLGLAHMGDACEIAWHQGLDLYGALDNRLATGFEYTARYNLGSDVAFAPDVDQTGKYRHKVISPPGPFRPVFEQIFNHYAKRRGVPVPWTQKVAQKLRPEGVAFQSDHTGFGTLLYSRDAGPDTAAFAAAAMPAGLHVAPEGAALRLTWIPPASLPCTVARAEYDSQKFTAVARNITTGSFLDSTVHPERRYIYRIIPGGEAPSSLPISAVAGLPSGWAATTAGEHPQAGTAAFDGVAWQLSSGGSTLQPETGGSLFSIHTEFTQHGMLTARLRPLFASQFLRAGLALFSGTSANTPCALLLLHPGDGGTDIEHPAWSVSLYERESATSALQPRGDVPLSPPVISWGRVSQPLWFRIENKQSELHASISTDGQAWTIVGSTTVPSGPLRAGLVLSSGLADVSAEAALDHVSVTSA